VRWTFQFTHHDLWDMDVGGQPTLMDPKTTDGVKPAVLVSTKQGSIYVLDRSNGKPIVPINEVPVPQSAVAGDHASPTQPKSDLNFMPPPLKEGDMWGVPRSTRCSAGSISCSCKTESSKRHLQHTVSRYCNS